MTDAPRRVAMTRKVSLAGLADDWEDCYAIVTLADFDLATEVSEKDFTSMSSLDIVRWEHDIAKRNFVAGRIRILNADGTSTLVDMTADDIASSTTIADRLYAAILGVTLDPKDTLTTTALSSTPSTTNSASTSESSTKTT